MLSILIVGRTGYKKIYFSQKLVRNKFFGQSKKVEQVSYIELNIERAAEIESCFSCNVEFHYLKGLEKLNDKILKLV